MPKILGIDLGTTNSCMAVMEVVNLLSLKLGRCTNYTVYRCFLPKWRTLSRSGGEAASCYERAKHRFLNQAFYGPEVRRSSGQSETCPYKIVKASNGDAHVEVAVGGQRKTYSPPEISAMILHFWTLRTQRDPGQEVG
jgi:molecular chaperone DnaK